ncbi:MAG: GGDEF domain-containing protein [Gammaproteobacteria bacterium]|nr:GGDEF domain-containing protein [Gammaproteobacteria bacterium]
MELHQVSAELDRVKNQGHTFNHPFEDESIERAFAQYRSRWMQGLKHGRTSLLAFAVICAALWDIISLPANSPYLGYLLASRALLLVSAVGVLQFAAQAQHREKYSFAGSILASVSIALSTAMLGFEGVALRIDGLLIGNALCVFLLDQSALRRIAATVIFNVLYLLSMIIASQSAVALLSTMISLGLWVLVSSYTLLAFERQQRENFLRELLLTGAQGSERDTGVWSRSVFDTHLNALMLMADGEDRHFCLAIASIDHFDFYNEHYGAIAGEALLARISRRLKECERDENDVVLRLNGVEFIVLLWNTNEDSAPDRAKLLVDSVIDLELEHAQSPHSDFVTLSVGLTVYHPKSDQSRSSLLESADTALVAAQSNGGNSFQLINDAKTNDL